MLEKLELTAKICSRSPWLHCFYICQPVTSQIYSAFEEQVRQAQLVPVKSSVALRWVVLHL